MPVVAAPRTAAERAIVSAMPALASGDPASGQKAAATPASTSNESPTVTAELAVDGPPPRPVMTALTTSATTKQPCKTTRALAAAWLMASSR